MARNSVATRKLDVTATEATEATEAAEVATATTTTEAAPPPVLAVVQTIAPIPAPVVQPIAPEATTTAPLVATERQRQGRGFSLSAEDKLSLVAERKAGAKLDALATKYQTSLSTVVNICREAGLVNERQSNGTTSQLSSDDAKRFMATGEFLVKALTDEQLSAAGISPMQIAEIGVLRQIIKQRDEAAEIAKKAARKAEREALLKKLAELGEDE